MRRSIVGIAGFAAASLVLVGITPVPSVADTVTPSSAAASAGSSAPQSIPAGPLRPGATRPSVRAASSGFTYVALGDSFSAGDGIKAKGWVNQAGKADGSAIATDGCNRSSKGYPELLDKWLGKQRAALPSMSLAFLACSGATTGDLWSGSPSQGDGLVGASGDNGEGYQLAYPQLSNARIVTLTIGGNDLNFSDVLTNCIDSLLHSCNTQSNDGWIADLSANIQTLQASLISTYQAIEAAAPYASVYVLGYPDIFPNNPTSGCQGLSQSALQYLASMQGPLNTVIQQAASDTGVNYVDPNTGPDSFAGHDVCQAKGSWVQGLRFGTTAAPFHPNQQGQAAMAATLEAAIGSGVTVIHPGPKSNVLVYGSGDNSGSDPNGSAIPDIVNVLSSSGFSVTNDGGSNALPSNINSFGQIWLDTVDAINPTDEWDLEQFVKQGGSLYMNGEWGSTANFDNQSVQDVLNTLVNRPPQVTGNSITQADEPVNTKAIDQIATVPNILTTWTPSENGDLSGVAKKNTLFTDSTGDASAGVWEVGKNGGRLAVLMDINWTENEFYDPATWSSVAQNLAHFLSN